MGKQKERNPDNDNRRHVQYANMHGKWIRSNIHIRSDQEFKTEKEFEVHSCHNLKQTRY